MNDPRQNPVSKNSSRRGFLFGIAWKTAAILGLLELGWLFSSLFASRRKHSLQTTAGASIIDAGTTNQYQPGEVKAYPRGKFYLVCLEDGSFLALSRTCTHLGCSVPWNEEEKQFICPCHGSTFDPKGVVLTAPAPRPLDYYPLRIENGHIRVDITRPLRRQHFDPSQTSKA